MRSIFISDLPLPDHKYLCFKTWRGRLAYWLIKLALKVAGNTTGYAQFSIPNTSERKEISCGN